MSARKPILMGDLVAVVSGPARGIRGEVIAITRYPRTGNDDTYRVLDRSGRVDRIIRTNAKQLRRARSCPYCGRGPCHGTASTANGRDLERFERIHPGRGIPERFPNQGASS